MQKTLGIKKTQSNFLFGERFNISESYISLLLGVVVVIAAVLLFTLFIRNKRPETTQSLPPSKISQELEKVKTEDTKSTHTVVAGDTLWSIAEKEYKSGYEWVKIAQANNLANPANIEVGTKLVLPKTTQAILATSTVAEKTTTEKTNAISGDKYTIKEGDYLWEIAIRAYGDGYKWPEIARVNNLENPDLIYPENELKLPR